MASSGKKKTTMAKLMRESRMRERKAAKQMRKDARTHSPLTATEELEASLAAGELQLANADFDPGDSVGDTGDTGADTGE
jgi:hypothetical protein